MIIDAVIPLLATFGRDLTSRQIAEAAGIAEGTIFRAFGDKESLVNAAIDKHLDPEPLRESLRAIDPALPLEHKVRAILYLLRERFESVMRVLAVVGHERPPVPHERHEFAAIIGRVLAPEADALNWPPERVAYLLRLISFASAFPQLNEGSEFSIDDLTRMVLVGIAGATATVPDATVSETSRSSATTAS